MKIYVVDLIAVHIYCVSILAHDFDTYCVKNSLYLVGLLSFRSNTLFRVSVAGFSELLQHHVTQALPAC
jgi:hypothetical protein